MIVDEISEKLAGHKKWLAGNPNGVRADFRGADLSQASLSGANLSGANLSDADLSHAHLSGANLFYANLSGADLSRADLFHANLSHAYLSGANLSDSELIGADLSRAYLPGSNISGANLFGANLFGANLSGADLSRADLFHANLAGAKLPRANLSDAKLDGTIGLNMRAINPLLMLLHQQGPIRAYKLVSGDFGSPVITENRMIYKIGKTIEVESASTDSNEECGPGISVATMPWIISNMRHGDRVLLVEFEAADIAAIPLGGGKFHLHRCTVVRELSPAELGSPQEVSNDRNSAILGVGACVCPDCGGDKQIVHVKYDAQIGRTVGVASCCKLCNGTGGIFAAEVKP